jgi:hypothetical protein
MMRRTISNLEFIEARAGPNGPYEVTQLVNSFIGALAHPWEELANDLSALSIQDAEALGWPVIDKELASDQTPRNLGELIRLIRNSLVHGNISLWEKKGEIAMLRVACFYMDEGIPPVRRRAWGAMITVEHLREFLTQFVSLAEELYEKRVRAALPKRA